MAILRRKILLATIFSTTFVGGGQTVIAQDQIVHDAEFLRMEQEFGEAWARDDDVVRQNPLPLFTHTHTHTRAPVRVRARK